MQGREDKILRALRSYIADEYRDKRGAEVDTSEWPIRCDETHGNCHLKPSLCARHSCLSPLHAWLQNAVVSLHCAINKHTIIECSRTSLTSRIMTILQFL